MTDAPAGSVPPGKVPVVAVVVASWKFLADNWRVLAPAAVLPALASGITAAVSPPPAPGVGPANMLEDLFGNLPTSLALVFFTAAVLRKAIRNEVAGPLGLSFGRDEILLLIVFVCFLAIFAVPSGLVLYVLETFVFARLAPTPEEFQALMADPERFNTAIVGLLGQGGVMAAEILVLAVLVFGAIALIRFAMVNAATIGERQIVLLRTWSWSNGNVFRILAALLMTNLPALLIAVIIGEILVALVGAGGPAASAPQAMLGSALVGFVSAVLSIPSVAVGAELYRGLKPPGFVAK